MQDFIGFDADSLRYIKSYTISDEVPGLSRAANALISPFRPTIGGNFLEQLAGGVYDRDGRLLPGCLQPRSDGHQAVQAEQPIAQAETPIRLPKAVFGGFAFDHFGHFLLETTARLWCLPEFSNLPWLFVTDGRPALRQYQIGFLQTLGLSPDQIVPVSSWHQVDELILPSPSFVYHHHATHAYRDTFRRAQLPPVGKGRRIFLSRSNTTIARTVGERELEAVLQGDGWDIVIPELLPPVEQARLFHDDNIVMGLQGSAMHLGLFGPPGRRCVHLCRGAGYRGYYILDDLVQSDTTYLVAMAEHQLRSKPITGPFLLDFEKTISFLRDRELLSQKAAAVAMPDARTHERLSGDYQAWWHYTESQIRYHRQLDNDGNTVPQLASFESALKAVDLRRDNPEILSHGLALALKFEGLDSAAALLERFEGWDDPSDPAAHAHLLHFKSIICDGRSQYEAALEAARGALALAPENAAYTNQFVTVLFRLRRLEEAEALLRALIETGSAVAGNYFLLSIIRLELGEIEEGIALARQAVQMDGNDIGVCQHLANTLIAHGREADALQSYRRFIERGSPVEFQLLKEVARLEEKLGDSEAALDTRIAAWRIAPDTEENRAEYIHDLMHKGLFPELSSLGTEITPAIKEHSAMIYRRSLALTTAGNLNEALRVAVVSVEMDPENGFIMQNLLGLMLQTKHAHEARLLARLLVDRGFATGETLYALSLIESDLGNGGSARDAAREAVEREPANEVIADHYRRLVAAAG